MHSIFEDISFIHLFQCFRFSCLYLTFFSKKTVFLYFLKTMIIDKEKHIFLFLHHFLLCSFILLYFIPFLFFLNCILYCCFILLFFYFCLFPTCQVRVVRFYQSCCPPPPPVSPPRPCLHQLPPPLPPCQLFAKLFANFRAQCALLDLNLGPSQLSEHRWTWDRPSSVRTAGPQPGTLRAQ